MLLPAAADRLVGNPDWRNFLTASGATAFVGGCLVLANRGKVTTLTRQQGFALTTASWLLICAFGALPLVLSDYRLDYADAFFETMSGLTTTGSTVLVNLDKAPPGILLWRALLQWLGGAGIIVVAIALLPFLRIGGMQLFKMESSDISEKSLPKITQIATGIILVYVVLTALCSLIYWIGGMTGFEAVTHAMATLATGGFSTWDDSFMHWNSAFLEWTAVVFMAIGGTPFIIYLRAALGDPKTVFQDRQVRAFAGFLAVVSAMVAAWLWHRLEMPFVDAFRHAAFNVVSITTTTGFASADYTLWGAFPAVIFFLLTFVGGCTGSTAGGIKMFRWEVMAIALRNHSWRLVVPHSVRAGFYGNRKLTVDVYGAVFLYVAVYLGTVAIAAIALGAFGCDLVTAVTGAATAVGNVGPGLGDIIGPVGNFATLPDGAKWVLSFAMLVGRLELFTVLVLFSPAFWKT